MITPGQILDVVCEELWIDREATRGPSRSCVVTAAREVVTFLSRELTTASYPDIARTFGKRSHSTFVHAEQRARRRLDEKDWLPVSDTIAEKLELSSYEQFIARVRERVMRQSKAELEANGDNQ